MDEEGIKRCPECNHKMKLKDDSVGEIYYECINCGSIYIPDNYLSSRISLNAYYRETLDYYPKPQEYLAYVINIYNKDKRVSKLIGIGFSAGGHNILEVALHKENYDSPRIDYLILGYPVITADNGYWHKGSFVNLLKDGINDLDLLNKLSLEKQVKSDSPELFLWSTFTDESVHVMNSLLLIEAYKNANVNCEYHMYPMGGHGLSLANSESSGGDKNKEIEYVSRWKEDSIKWLRYKLIENNS